MLGPEHFHEGLHARLYEKTAELISTGKRADVLILKDYFADDATLLGLRGIKYLARLAASAMPSMGAVQYARHLVELAERRRVLACMLDIKEMAKNPHVDGAAIASSADRNDRNWLWPEPRQVPRAPIRPDHGGPGRHHSSQ